MFLLGTLILRRTLIHSNLKKTRTGVSARAFAGTRTRSYIFRCPLTQHLYIMDYFLFNAQLYFLYNNSYCNYFIVLEDWKDSD